MKIGGILLSIKSTRIGHDEPHVNSPARAKTKNPFSEPRIWVRPKEACRIGGFGLTRCYELLNDGKLKSRKVGRMRLINIQSIEEL